MSGSVFLSNLDDFIAPSQSCVNPLVNAKQDASKEAIKSSKIEISTDYTKSDFDDISTFPNLIQTRQVDSANIATVSLNDCLACSGCVTSAETMLIQEQSFEKLIDVLKRQDQFTIVVMISPNSRCSVADYFQLPAMETFLKISSVLKSVGVQWVLDASVGGDIALIESAEEFLHRHKTGKQKAWVKPPTTTAVSSTELNFYSTQKTQMGSSLNPSYSQVGPPALTQQGTPMFTSNCPGWVCYVEKTQPQAIPYVSTVKSPQQILGALVKGMLKNRESDGEGSKGKIPFVVSIQPCFDKKLEASRLDFWDQEDGREVDLVLSSSELLQLLEAIACSSDPRSIKTETTTGTGMDITQDLNGISVSFIQQSDNTSTTIPGSSKVERREKEEMLTKHQDANNQGMFSVPSHEEKNVGATSNDRSNVSEKQKELSWESVSAPKGQQMDKIEADTNPAVFLKGQINIDEVNKLTKNERSEILSKFFETVEMDDPRGCDETEKMFRHCSEDGRRFVLAAEEAAGSGGFSDFVYRYSMERLYGINIWGKALSYKTGRNPDIAEIECDLGEGVIKPALKFGRAYGFRNIQSVMLKMRRGTCDWDFLEVMACPSGCNNGGGQIKHTKSSNKPPLTSVTGMETTQESKDRVGRLEQLFHRDVDVRNPSESPLVRHVYTQSLASSPLSREAQRLFHTRYHAVPKLEEIAPMAAKW